MIIEQKIILKNVSMRRFNYHHDGFEVTNKVYLGNDTTITEDILIGLQKTSK